MKIRIDGIATVWLQKRGLPTKRGATAEEYKAKVEAYLKANPADWPYYNRVGRLDPFGGAPPEAPTKDEINTAKHWDEEPAHVVIQQQLEQPEPKKKVFYVIVREARLGFREYLKTYAYADQKEEDKWSSNPAWADRFLVPDGAKKVAERILGHNNFKIEPLDKQK